VGGIMIYTFYLFNEDILDFDQAIKQDRVEGENPYTRLEPTPDLPPTLQIQAYFQMNKSTSPTWLSFISDYFVINKDEIRNVTNSLILLIKIEERIFAVTSGFGYSAINKHQIVRDFGLRVVLNEIDPEKILKVDSRNLDSTTKQKTILINRNSPISEFEFDFNEDLISQIGGKPAHGEYGRNFTGADSLRLSADLSLPQLDEKCRQLLNIYQADSYKKYFAFYDVLKEVKSFKTIEKLESNKINSLKNQQQIDISITPPDINEINDIYEYKIYQSSKSLVTDDLDISSIYSFIKDNPELEVVPEKITIYGINSSGQRITSKYDLNDFLVFETDFENKHYIFTLNRWFEIDSNFYKEVQESIKNFTEITDPNFLPAMKSKETEGDYNIRAGISQSYLLLDKKDFQEDSFTKIEVCDLLTPQKHFICVKTYKSSSTLSHLFSQGLVSAELLSGEIKYRKFVFDKTPKTWPNPMDINNLDKREITYVYAVASKKGGPFINTLPFFSKVSLRNAVRSIQRLGFNVSIYKIPII
jgi:uncharacterized protein (TIGR04141 family)